MQIEANLQKHSKYCSLIEIENKDRACYLYNINKISNSYSPDTVSFLNGNNN
jgi:hypothetical protein